MGASWQAFYAHLCAASIIRAMPETEIRHQVKQVQHPEKRKLRRGISNRGICEDGC